VLSFQDCPEGAPQRMDRRNTGAPEPSLRTVAMELGITRERVRQIYKSVKIRFRLHLCARREKWGC
jgi:DNA-directed RNA polymerase sigma subunit (sigma70/sigma32)